MSAEDLDVEPEVLEARRELERQRRSAEADLVAVMSTVPGRRFMFRMLNERCCLWSSSFAGEAPLTSAHNEGQRQIGVDLLKDLKRACPQLYGTMMDEQLAADRIAADKNRTE